jgi:hypothetical protein
VRSTSGQAGRGHETRVRILAISVLTFAGFPVVYAGCAGAGPRADFEQDFRRGTRGAWFTLLVTRYGCDTVLVKARATGALAPGLTACAAAEWVRPYVVRAWSDSTGIQEEWNYVGFRSGNVAGNAAGTAPTRGWSPGGSCRLTLRGRDQRDLRVSDISC